MDNDNTVFQNPGTAGMGNPPSMPENPVSQQQTVPPVQQPLVEQAAPPPPPFPVVPPIQDNPTIVPSVPPPAGHVGLVKRIIKILLGLFAVIAVIFIAYSVILPMFTKSNGGKVNLTYWGLWEDPRVMQSIIADFQRQNPNIVVTYSNQDSKQYRDRLITRIKNGTGPDIFRFHNSWTKMLSGVLLPIPSDVISKDEFFSDFYPVAQNDLIKNGAIYGVPLEIDTLGLYINNQIFQSAGLNPPTNWNEFVDDARSLTVKGQDGKIKTAGAAMGTYDNVNHAPDILSLLFLQNSVDLSNLSNSTDRVKGALTFYSSFTTDQNNVWDNSLDPSTLAFAKGNLAMYFGYSWDYFTIKQFNPNLNFQIVSVPQLPNQNVTMASYWAEGASVRSPHQKEALLFLKYLAQKETEQKLYSEESKTRAFGEPYARKDLADTLKDNPNIYPFISQAKYALSSYFVDSTNDNSLNQEANTYLGNAINSMVNGSSADTVFDTLTKGISQVLQKYGQ